MALPRAAGRIGRRHGPARSGVRLTRNGKLAPDRGHWSHRAPWLLTCAIIAAAWVIAGCVHSASASTELHFEWRTGEGFQGEISLHEAGPDQPQGETLMYREGEEPPLRPEVPGAVVHGEVGAVAKLLIVVRNPTAGPLRFWVAPHLPLPYSADRGLSIQCLCTGQQYEIPPHGMWTRVIQAGLTPDAGTRGPVVITHVFVAGEVPRAD